MNHLDTTLAFRIELQISNKQKWKRFTSYQIEEKSMDGNSVSPLEILLTKDNQELNLQVFRAVCPYFYQLQVNPIFDISAKQDMKQKNSTKSVFDTTCDDSLAEILLFCSEEEMASGIAPTCFRFRKIIGTLAFLRAMGGEDFAALIQENLQSNGFTHGNWQIMLSEDLIEVRELINDAISQYPDIANVSKEQIHQLSRAERFIFTLLNAVPDIITRLDILSTVLSIGPHLYEIRKELKDIIASCHFAQSDELFPLLIASVLEFGNKLNAHREDTTVDLLDMTHDLCETLKAVNSRFGSEFTGIDQVLMQAYYAIEQQEEHYSLNCYYQSMKELSDTFRIVSGKAFHEPSLRSKFAQHNGVFSRIEKVKQICNSIPLDKMDGFYHQMKALIRLVQGKVAESKQLHCSAIEAYQQLLRFIDPNPNYDHLGYNSRNVASLGSISVFFTECERKLHPKQVDILTLYKAAKEATSLERGAIFQSAANAAKMRVRDKTPPCQQFVNTKEAVKNQLSKRFVVSHNRIRAVKEEISQSNENRNEISSMLNQFFNQRVGMENGQGFQQHGSANAELGIHEVEVGSDSIEGLNKRRDEVGNGSFVGPNKHEENKLKSSVQKKEQQPPVRNTTHTDNALSHKPRIETDTTSTLPGKQLVHDMNNPPHSVKVSAAPITSSTIPPMSTIAKIRVKFVNWKPITVQRIPKSGLWKNVQTAREDVSCFFTENNNLGDMYHLFSCGQHVALSKIATSKRQLRHFTSEHFQRVQHSLEKGQLVRYNTPTVKSEEKTQIQSEEQPLQFTTLAVLQAIVEQKLSNTNMNRSKLEQYLNDDDFMLHFGISKDKFKNLPTWKQQNAKKALGLF